MTHLLPTALHAACPSPAKSGCKGKTSKYFRIRISPISRQRISQPRKSRASSSSSFLARRRKRHSRTSPPCQRVGHPFRKASRIWNRVKSVCISTLLQSEGSTEALYYSFARTGFLRGFFFFSAQGVFSACTTEPSVLPACAQGVGQCQGGRRSPGRSGSCPHPGC